ncbi:Peptidyl-tRNA hydrolase [Apis cerana cerana]|uniref:peptidyl-tRNA hydrolase n=1 Tax=Apis cerana cerana TaxID=94128 RepID=A0A2A3EQ82_APICC|nr:Peptidyl-tRNA hydrolase [Apis cerana cerana]
MIPKLNSQQQNIEDPVEEMLKKTGCMEFHYEVQECIAETQDWRKCQEQVKRFKGKTAAQCAHAAVECCHQVSLNANYQQIYKSWLLQGQSKIVLKISSEEELLSLAKNARKAGLITSIIKDAGKTQLQPGTISTLGIGPGPKQLINNLTLNLKLFNTSKIA